MDALSRESQPAAGWELFTDLYELTMLQAYFNEGMEGEATFELYVRTLPPERNFLIAAGLDQALSYLENLAFSPPAIEYLQSLGSFTPVFLDHLTKLRFTGNVRAVPEGTVAFAREPLLEVTAPIAQAQLVETYLLNQVTFQTLIASKGARAVLAARGRTLVDFGSRRAHGADAALKAARALYLAGYEATSNVLAGRTYGIPVAGTMAHSYIQAHESEREAFEAFLLSYPATVLLLDTYDTGVAARLVASLAESTGGLKVRGVRLDSGDLGVLAKDVRQVLDRAGLNNITVFASGGLDEWQIEALVKSGAPIDGFGVGTDAVVSLDAPVLDSAYKLVAYGGRDRMKLSDAKATLPGKKQVFRERRDGRMASDTIALVEEVLPGQPLLEEVMRAGRRTAAGGRSLEEARQRTTGELALLPESLRTLAKSGSPYEVSLSAGLAAERDRLAAALKSRI